MLKKKNVFKSYVETAELWRNTPFKWFFSTLIHLLELYREFAKKVCTEIKQIFMWTRCFLYPCIYILNVSLNGEARFAVILIGR